MAIFDRFSYHQWWDDDGPAKILHHINPLRIEWATHTLGRTTSVAQPLADMRLLEIGCGGGILSVPLVTMGASVVGVDTSAGAICAAKTHRDTLSSDMANRLDFVCADATQWIHDQAVDTRTAFDAVIIMEVLEHVDKPASLLADLMSTLKPGGMVLGSTLNRTPKSYMHAIVMAEHMLNWVPVGTHDWTRFIAPEEINQWATHSGYTAFAAQGFGYATGHSPPWHLVSSTQVNYFFACRRPA